MAAPPTLGLRPAEAAAAERLWRLAIDEDLGDSGDVTSRALIPADVQAQAAYVARQAGVLAGMACLPILLRLVEEPVRLSVLVEDGQPFEKGQRLAVVSGPARTLLALERLSLNLLQRLSGIATLTRRFVEAVRGHPAQILDTRKTTPGLRLLEKYAVRAGGGRNHRLGLYDQILIKDNHLASLRASSPEAAVPLAVAKARQHAPGLTVEIEVDTLDQLRAALATDADIVMLDNMDLPTLRQAVRLRDAGPRAPQPRLEASGGVTLDQAAAVAATGVDFISVGAMTHSAVAVDIGLDFEPLP